MRLDSASIIRFASRGLPRTKRGLIVLFAVQWSFIAAFIVFLIVVSSQEGPEEVFHEVIVPLSIFLGIVLVGIVLAFSSTIPGRIRAMSLRRRYPEAVVKTSTLSVWDREAIFTMRNRAHTPHLLIFSAALLFDSDGISVWSGVLRPECLARLPWSEVRGIRVLDETPTWLVVSTLSIASTLDEEDLQFTMVSRRRLGIALAGRAELERLAAHLEGLAQPGR